MKLNPFKKRQPEDHDVQLTSYDEAIASEKTGCCARTRNEWNMNFYQLRDNNGKTLHLESSFSMDRTWWKVAVKLVLFGATVGNFVWGFIDSEYPNFHMAYLSHWGLFYASLYMTFSVILSLGCGKNGSFLVQSAWILFSIAMVHEIMITTLYWLLLYDPDNDTLKYKDIVTHGGAAGMIFIDGLILNRTPIRLRHWYWTLFLSLLFVGWSLLQSYVVGRNPYDNGDDRTDDAIYAPLGWKDDPGYAAMISSLTVFVASPIFHVTIWMISLPGRRYTDDMPQEEIGGVVHEEDGLMDDDKEQSSSSHRFWNKGSKNPGASDVGDEENGGMTQPAVYLS